jgi:nucleoside-diphosphate kinase
MRLSTIQAEELYAPHKNKAFYKSLIGFITSAPIVAVTLEGKNAIQLARKMIGATDPLEAQPGSIRGDYSMDMRHNLVHASDSPESFKREFNVVFNGEEVYNYVRSDENILYPP